MAFTDNAEFEDDFRKVGPDATADFAPSGTTNNPTEHASSANVEVAGAADVDEDLEEEEELDAEDDADEDDLEDDDLDEDEDQDEDDTEDDEEEDDDDEEDEDEDDDDLEVDDATVQARLADAEKRVRTK